MQAGLVPGRRKLRGAAYTQEEHDADTATVWRSSGSTVSGRAGGAGYSAIVLDLSAAKFAIDTGLEDGQTREAPRESQSGLDRAGHFLDPWIQGGGK